MQAHTRRPECVLNPLLLLMYTHPLCRLTLTDLSHPMLQKAEDAYFDKLRLGYKHPDVRITFAVADAHCMVQQESVVPQVQAGGNGRAGSPHEPGKRCVMHECVSLP